MRETLLGECFGWFRRHASYLWLVSHPLPGFALLSGFVLGDSESQIVREIAGQCFIPWVLSGPVLALGCIAVTPDKQPGRAYMLLVSLLTMPAFSALTFAVCYVAPLIAFPLFVLWLLAARRTAAAGIWE